MRRPRAVAPAGSSPLELPARGEAEAHPAHGVDVARGGGIVAQLPAKPADMDVEGLARPEPLGVPDLLERSLARHDDPGVGHQELEQLVLLAREVQGASGAGARPGGGIELYLAEREPLGGFLL